MDIKSSSSVTSGNSIMYQAIKDNKIEEIKLLLDNGIDVNAPIWTTGPFAGYTALHAACMENKDELVKLLISDYKADVNAVAEDGVEPIHLACLYEPYTSINNFYTDFEKLIDLLDADANPDAEFGQEIFTKHVKDEEWNPDFGEKMTLLTYTILYKKPELADCLVKYSTNVKIKSLKNKTLLMYALEYDFHDVVSSLLYAIEGEAEIKDPVYLNHRDDDGIPAVHYVLYPKKYNQFRYDSLEQRFGGYNKRGNMLYLIETGADKYSLLNGDPATFLPNIAAYRSCGYLLQGLLSRYQSMPLSKVLYNAMLPIDDNLEKIMRFHPRDQPDEYPTFMERIQKRRQETIEVALNDLVIRQTFGLHTNKEEIKLMKSLIATDADIKKIVDNFTNNFINRELKRQFLNINNKKISVFDFLKQVFNDKKLKLWARDENACDWSLSITKTKGFHNEYDHLNRLAYARIVNRQERFQLLNKLDKISILRKAIDLPYEIVLDFIEYLNNTELEVFINAFIY